MKELVVFLAKHLVNNPDSVEVRETQGETASVSSTQVNSATWPWLASAKRKS